MEMNMGFLTNLNTLVPRLIRALTLAASAAQISNTSVGHVDWISTAMAFLGGFIGVGEPNAK
jgi:hypothetical protein